MSEARAPERDGDVVAVWLKVTATASASTYARRWAMVTFALALVTLLAAIG